jgi:hypothetical protein
MASSSIVKVGLSQMTCGEDPKKNLAHQLALAESALKKGAKIFCTQELFRPSISARSRTIVSSRSRKPFRSSTDAFSKLAKKYKAVIIASLFEKRAAGVYHNTARSSTRTDRSWACIARCTSPTIRCLREVLLHAGRHRLHRVEDQGHDDWHVGLLGSVVP